jgi:hypothetical protein
LFYSVQFVPAQIEIASYLLLLMLNGSCISLRQVDETGGGAACATFGPFIAGTKPVVVSPALVHISLCVITCVSRPFFIA